MSGPGPKHHHGHKHVGGDGPPPGGKHHSKRHHHHHHHGGKHGWQGGTSGPPIDVNPKVHHGGHHGGGNGSHQGGGWDRHDLNVCVSEALVVSLRLAGQPIRPEETLRLHRLVGREWPPIEYALERVQRFGLLGFRPVIVAALSPWDIGAIVGLPLPLGYHAATADAGGLWSWGRFYTWNEWPYPLEIAEVWPVSWS